MQAAVFEGMRTICVRTIPDPEPMPDDIVIRVKACGIRGSDLHSYTTGAYQPGQVMGHEFWRSCGVGSHVQGIAVGERVTAMPFNACHACQACMRARHTCATTSGQAIAYGLLERLPNIWPPRRRSIATSSITSTAQRYGWCQVDASGGAAVRRQPDIGAKVVAIGAGLIGQCMIQALKAGVGLVVVSEVSGRAGLARLAVMVLNGDRQYHRASWAGHGFVPGRRTAAADMVLTALASAAFGQALRLAVRWHADPGVVRGTGAV